MSDEARGPSFRGWEREPRRRGLALMPPNVHCPFCLVRLLRNIAWAGNAWKQCTTVTVPSPCAHGPGHAGDFSILNVIFSHLQLAALEVVESFLFLLGLGKLARSPAWLFLNAQLLGVPHS